MFVWGKDSYPSSISNQRITNIKKEFIQLVQTIQEYDLIEDKYKTISDGKLFKADQLTIQNISEGFVLYEKISI